MPERDDAEMKGKITEDDVQRYRNRIGVLIPDSPPFNHEAHKDTIRHFANCYGDDNPLFCDEDYAKDTRWGGIVAPPQYIITLERTTVPPIPPEVRKAGAGALRGVPNIPLRRQLRVGPPHPARRPDSDELLHRERRGEAERVRRREGRDHPSPQGVHQPTRRDGRHAALLLLPCRARGVGEDRQVHQDLRADPLRRRLPGEDRRSLRKRVPPRRRHPLLGGTSSPAWTCPPWSRAP